MSTYVENGEWDLRGEGRPRLCLPNIKITYMFLRFVFCWYFLINRWWVVALPSGLSACIILIRISMEL